MYCLITVKVDVWKAYLKVLCSMCFLDIYIGRFRMSQDTEILVCNEKGNPVTIAC